MNYDGQEIDALFELAQRIVTNHDVNLDAAAERWQKHLAERHARLCAKCNRSFGEHGYWNDPCKFVPLSCEACVTQWIGDEGIRCGKNCVPGTRMCAEHLSEAL